jgi:hypothetical protein
MAFILYKLYLKKYLLDSENWNVDIMLAFWSYKSSFSVNFIQKDYTERSGSNLKIYPFWFYEYKYFYANI